MAKVTQEVASLPAVVKHVRASARQKHASESGKQPLHRCTTHGYVSDPEATPEAQQHGYDVHTWRAHGTTKKHSKAKKNKVVKSTAAKAGTIQVVTENGIKTFRPRTKPPKAFFDLKDRWIKEAANCSGDEQDAFMACATDLGRLLKSFK